MGSLSRPTVFKYNRELAATQCTKAMLMVSKTFGVVIIACGATKPCPQHEGKKRGMTFADIPLRDSKK